MTARKQRAFTLVELVMVIVLLGILSAVTLPKFFEKNTYAERAFFDDTLNAFRYAQKLAVAIGCSVEVSISSNSYTLTRQGSSSSTLCPGGTTYSLAVPHPSSGASSYTGSEPGVSLTPDSTVIFSAKGTASTNTLLTVGGTRTLSVIAETGFVYAP